MATLELQNMPEELMEEIRRRARSHGVSVEEQVVRDLSAIPNEPPARTDEEEEKMLEEIRREREELASRGVFITKEMIDEAKNWGRK
jgi:plasmid stability protein